MSAATWFVAILFEINIFCYLIEWFSCEFLGKKYQYSFVLRTIAAIVLVCVGYLLMRLKVNSMQIGTFCSAYVAFYLGNVLKTALGQRENELNNFKGIVGTFSFIILVCLLAFSNQEIRLIDNQIINPFYYILAGCAGWFMVRSLSLFLLNRFRLLSNVLKYIGKKSMVIMCGHLLAFKLVAVIQCMTINDFSGIANHPVVFVSGSWWILYSLVGIILPIIVARITSMIKNSYKKVKIQY